MLFGGSSFGTLHVHYTHLLCVFVCPSYRFNPWRAPGYAPVVDPCGQAGGKLKHQNIGGDSIFTDNQFAKMGDLGSKLPPSKNKTKWTAGEYVEVGWGPLYNHGGGYVLFRIRR